MQKLGLRPGPPTQGSAEGPSTFFYCGYSLSTWQIYDWLTGISVGLSNLSISVCSLWNVRYFPAGGLCLG